MFHSPTRFLMVVCLSFRYSSIHVCSMSAVYAQVNKALASRWRSFYQPFPYFCRVYVVALALHSRLHPHFTGRTAFALCRCNMRDLGLCSHDCVRHSWQICQLHIHEANLQIPVLRWIKIW